jgi:hypothetical protein
VPKKTTASEVGADLQSVPKKTTASEVGADLQSVLKKKVRIMNPHQF